MAFSTVVQNKYVRIQKNGNTLFVITKLTGITLTVKTESVDDLQKQAEMYYYQYTMGMC